MKIKDLQLKYYKALLLFLIACLSACGGGSENSTSTTSSTEKTLEDPDSSSVISVVDTAPDIFVFQDQKNVRPKTVVESNEIIITGIDTVVDVRIIGGDYSINGGSFTSVNGHITNGQRIRLRLTTGFNFDSTFKATITVGDISSDFSVFTSSPDTSPDMPIFNTITEVARDELIDSNSVTLSGFDIPIFVSIINGQYSINDGEFSTHSTEVLPGDSLQIRVLSDTQPNTLTAATLRLGTIESTFSVVTSEDIIPPSATIVFPLGNTMVERESIIIRGTVSDNNQVRQVKINDQLADIDQQSGSWTARMSLKAGLNKFSVVATDLAGNTSTETIETQVERQAFLEWPDAIAIDNINQIAYIADTRYDSLFTLNLKTGNRELLSSANVGGGPAFDGFDGLLFDQPNARLIATDASSDALFEINIDSGERRIISNEFIGTGISFSGPTGLTFDASRSEVFIADFDVKAIIAVNLLTGNRRLISGESRGTGPSFDNPTDVVLHSSLGFLYVVDSNLDSVLLVDPATGDRTLISNGKTGSSQSLLHPYDIVIDEINERLFIADRDPISLITGNQGSALFSLELDSGELTLVSGRGQGDGEQLKLLTSLAYNEFNESVILGDFVTKKILEVNVESGERTVLSDRNGSYELDWKPTSLVFNHKNSNLMVGDSSSDVVYSVDTRNNNVSVLLDRSESNDGIDDDFYVIDINDSNSAIYGISGFIESKINKYEVDTGLVSVVADVDAGSGLDIFLPRQMHISNNEDRLFISSAATNDIISINLNSGVRDSLTGQNSGSGAIAQEPSYFVLDEINSRLIVTDVREDSVYSVDLNSGFRTLLSSSFDRVGNGAQLNWPQFPNYESTTDTLVLYNQNEQQLISVNLANGNRTVLTDISLIEGPWNQYIVGFVYDFSMQRAFIAEDHEDYVIMLDLVSNSSVLLFP